ncbi:STAS domain-containing protein [Nocardiopsis akebiae]|uniref:Anti-sigma factor antagonist n=1 Tax=Nocardiopsis akebiae TaxID=2831968 RepID=A0ABX8C2L1_9ACTN|nr:STAS domain-containing protein [Nocardiopsis akebiae]QUX27667.1 STAS domain-containing protein [Nocardiopsis akebiae]
MAPFTQHPPTVSDTPPSVPRLRLNSTPYRGAVLDGGWWPRSGDPVAELPGLVLALDAHRGTVHGLELGVTGWRTRPELLAVAGRAVHLSWSLDMPADLLVAVACNGSRTRLLVVPPGTGAFTASSALDLAALATNTARASEVMGVASMLPPPPRTAPETDWESEGGLLHEAEGTARTSRRPRSAEAAPREEHNGPRQVLVRVRGEIDLATVPSYRDDLFDALRADADRVVVDLSGVTFFSAAGVSLLAAAWMRAEALGVDLRLAAPSEQVRRVLGIIGMHELSPVYATTEEAMLDSRR